MLCMLCPGRSCAPSSNRGLSKRTERTAIYAKVSGFVDSWKVDINARVEPGQVLVKLRSPELVEQHLQMQAQVDLDKVMVEQAGKLVTVAESNVTASTEIVAQASSDVKRYEADVERWVGEVKRLTDLVKEKVVDQQVLDETRRQLQSSQAALESSRVGVKSRDAQRLSAQATLAKVKVDVDVAKAQVRVAEAEERRLAALVDYLTIKAPYDGFVFARNVNAGDFILPATGDPSQGTFSLGVSPSRATPLYVLFRSDPILFVVGVPETDAPYVEPGKTKARVRIPRSADLEFESVVTRTSVALDSTSRTLLTQIELKNPDGKLVPGMYAYGSVIIERPNARALPESAITQIGNQTCCYLIVDGKAVRTPVQTGVSDGSWIEVTAKRVQSTGSSTATWAAFDGAESVIDGDLSQVSDGQSVVVGSQSN